MKTYQINILTETDQESVENILNELAQKGTIEFHEVSASQQTQNKSVPATEDQIEEIIDESEIGPYYSEKEAKNILNL
ncbi:hypothetical protein [Dyadobacter sp. NIV53]|uniref:hypothetical protein n=1 Tax=Dyadobacter sp. NIV53 TaxID=2861765 RepID=UPI001C87A8CD|nr:hypothetical protein [Dyadobacter sp. NIV53]